MTDNTIDEQINSIIKQLIFLRNEKGMTHEEVYNKTEIHIGRIESSKGNITLKTLFKLLETYDATIGDLITKENFVENKSIHIDEQESE